jgi:hypothetical protein
MDRHVLSGINRSAMGDYQRLGGPRTRCKKILGAEQIAFDAEVTAIETVVRWMVQQGPPDFGTWWYAQTRPSPECGTPGRSRSTGNSRHLRHAPSAVCGVYAAASRQYLEIDISH